MAGVAEKWQCCTVQKKQHQPTTARSNGRRSLDDITMCCAGEPLLQPPPSPPPRLHRFGNLCLEHTFLKAAFLLPVTDHHRSSMECSWKTAVGCWLFFLNRPSTAAATTDRRPAHFSTIAAAVDQFQCSKLHWHTDCTLSTCSTAGYNTSQPAFTLFFCLSGSGGGSSSQWTKARSQLITSREYNVLGTTAVVAAAQHNTFSTINHIYSIFFYKSFFSQHNTHHRQWQQWWWWRRRRQHNNTQQHDYYFLQLWKPKLSIAARTHILAATHATINYF